MSTSSGRPHFAMLPPKENGPQESLQSVLASGLSACGYRGEASDRIIITVTQPTEISTATPCSVCCVFTVIMPARL